MEPITNTKLDFFMYPFGDEDYMEPAMGGLLNSRGEQYGEFKTQAMLSQRLKKVLKGGKTWGDMLPIQKEALEMIEHKIARILNGNADHIDSWIDIAGYATLVSQWLNELNQPEGAGE